MSDITFGYGLMVRADEKSPYTFAGNIAGNIASNKPPEAGSEREDGTKVDRVDHWGIVYATGAPVNRVHEVTIEQLLANACDERDELAKRLNELDISRAAEINELKSKLAGLRNKLTELIR